MNRFPILRGLSTLSAFFASTVLSVASEASPVLWENFGDSGQGGLREALEQHPLLDIVEGEGVDGGPALRATYRGYDQGSRRIVVTHPIGVSSKEFTLSYDVRFEEGFQFTDGGKMHGLGPVRRATGGAAPGPKEWSARINFARDGAVRTYLYHQRLPGRYGQGLGGGDFRFQPATYHAVSLHVKLNDPVEENNGFARIYIDGELRVDHDEIQFRSVDDPDSLISHLLFSTFHGGSTPRWAPRDEDGNYTTVYAWFDNFAVYSGEKIRFAPGACWE